MLPGRYLSILLLFCVVVWPMLMTFGKGGRGGGSRGSRGGRSSSRVSSRAYSRFYSRSSRSYKGGYRSSWSKGGSTFTYSGGIRQFRRKYKTTALTLGIIYGTRRFRSRFDYSDVTSDSEDSICFNINTQLTSSEIADPNKYQTWYYKNKTVYGLFMCPTDDDDNKVYCCGDEDSEYCCTFWDDAERVVAVVFVILIGVGVLLFAAFIAYKIFCKGNKSSRVSTTSNINLENRAKSVDKLEMNTDNDGSTPPPPKYDNLYPPAYSE